MKPRYNKIEVWLYPGSFSYVLLFLGNPGSRGPFSKHLRWNTPCLRFDKARCFFDHLTALCASLTWLLRESSVSIRKKYPLEPMVLLGPRTSLYRSFAVRTYLLKLWKLHYSNRTRPLFWNSRNKETAFETVLFDSDRVPHFNQGFV